MNPLPDPGGVARPTPPAQTRASWREWLGVDSRVSRRILLWVLAVGVAGTLTVSVWQSQRDYLARVAHVDRELGSLASLTAPALTSSLWTFQSDAIEAHLDAFAQVPVVSAVRLEIDGQPARHRGVVDTDATRVQRSVPLVHVEDGKPHALGTLTLINDLRNAQAETRTGMLTTMVGNALVVLLSALGSVVIYHLIVTRRLVSIARQLRGVTASDLRALPPPGAAPLRSGPGDELDELADSIAMLQATGRQALRDSDDDHAQLRSLMDSIPDLVWLKDPEGRYLACNPRFEQLYGCREVALLGKDDFDFRDRETAEGFRMNDRLAMEAGGPRKNEEWLTFIDGGYRGLFETIKTPVRMPDGRLVGVLGIARDITARKAAEDAIREERRVRETIMESIPGVFYAIDPAGKLVFWNRNFEQVTERSADELSGLPANELFRGDDRRAVAERVGAVFTEGYAEIEADLVALSGKSRAYFFTGLRIEVAGQPLLVGTGIDISARRQAEIELKQLNLELEGRVLARTADLRAAHDRLADTQVAMDCVGIGITWADFETGHFIHANRHMAHFLGYTTEELLKLGMSDIDPNLPPAAYRQRAVAIREAGHLQFETTQRTKSGQVVPVEMSIYYQAASGDVPPRFIAFMSDISRRKEAEQALLRAKEDAEAASHAKSAFLANMSHEIRTPMNAIIGLTHLLRRANPTADQAEKLTKVETSGRHLLTIINDILDLAKIEAGRMELDSTDFHLSSVLDNVASIIREPARAKGLAVEIDTDSVPMWLRGDPTRLRQALLNFAGNAVKFTDAGTVAISAELLEDRDGELLVRFQVSDTGVGIAADKIGLLFNEFEQTDNSPTRRHGGTGLGLAITRRLALLMNGEVGVRSTPGVGSSFWFTARLHRGKGLIPNESETPTSDPEPWLRLRHLQARILLVEDNLINREVALQLLHGSSLAVDTAEDGAQALQKAREQHYDLVLMDMQMPVMDGVQATRAIRRLPGWADTPIVAMTANAFEEDRRACMDAGMNAFITKPVEAPVLHGVLLKWLTRPANTAAGELDGTATPSALADLTAPVGDGGEQESPTEAALRRLAAVAGMDVARGVAACLGRRERYLELFGRLLTTQTLAVAQMQQALARGDHAGARFLAHNLKGAASTLGANGLADQSAALDAALRAGTGALTAPPVWAERASALADTLTELSTALELPPA